jgi:hypothetical protein
MKTTLVALAVGLATTMVYAQGQQHAENTFVFEQAALEALEVDSVLQINTDQLVFNDALGQLDWGQFFINHTTLSISQQEIVMHYAGLYSINPAVLIALMQVSDTAQSDKPFGSLSEKAGFQAQLEDIAGFLTQRIYAYKAFELQHESFVKRRVMNPANIALASLASRSAKDDLIAQLVAKYNECTNDIFY